MKLYKIIVAKFKTKLTKWGNSVGLNIPKPLRDTLEMKEGDDIELEDKNDHIILRKR
jgi:AbrB family looped-hinge helix DNA binding protein